MSVQAMPERIDREVVITRPRRESRVPSSAAATARLPFVSIVIATYNRARQLDRCLRAIAALDYPRDRFEVIVVDDGGDQPLDDIVGPLCAGMNARLIRQPNSGPGPARNAGVRRAKGDLLAFTDDDCIPDAAWLKNLARRFDADRGRAIGGCTMNALRGNPYSTTSQVILDVVYQHYNRDPKGAVFFATCNLAVPARVFRDIGGFDEAFTGSASEDRDLCDRWLQLGHSMQYAPECLVYHAHDLALTSLWRQHFGYGRGAFRFYRARLTRGLGRVRPEPLLHAKFLLYPFVHARPARACFLSALVAMTQVASAIGYFRERIKRRA